MDYLYLSIQESKTLKSKITSFVFLHNNSNAVFLEISLDNSLRVNEETTKSQGFVFFYF